MYIDLGIILIVSCGVTALQGLLMAIVWLQDRSATSLLWKSALFVLGGFFLFLFLIDSPELRVASIGLGTSVFLAACFMCWASARSFEGRPVPLALLAAIETGWLAICLVPHLLDNLFVGAVVQSIAGGLFIGGAAWEHWRNRATPRLANRWGLIVLYAAVALVFAVRIPFTAILPFPFGAAGAQIGWIATYVFGLAAAAIILSFLSIMTIKERAESELRTFALTDALTGLLNRRAFAVDVARMARKHLRSGIGYCLVLFDLDHFKQVNDSQGHDYGDAVLKSFAAAANTVLPDAAVIYRIGGEEFCCIMSETGGDAAVRLADKLRVTFRSTRVLQTGHGVEVSVSAGVASSLDAGSDPAAVQALADEALYRAKRLGRDRVCIGAQEPLPHEDVHWAA